MSNEELRVAAGQIIRTSSSEDEVRRRLKEEIDYPYSIAITSTVPTDSVGRQARNLVVALGGLTMSSGAMVMVMMYGHQGKTISL